MIDVFLDEEMDMPCLCDCQEWFDLNDGKRDELTPNRIVCPECHQKQQARKTTIGILSRGESFTTSINERYKVTKLWSKRADYIEAKDELGFYNKFYNLQEIVFLDEN